MRFVLALGVVVALAAPARADDDEEGVRGAEKGALGVGIILGNRPGSPRTTSTTRTRCRPRSDRR